MRGLPETLFLGNVQSVVTAGQKVIADGNGVLCIADIQSGFTSWFLHPTLPTDAKLANLFTAGGCCFATYHHHRSHQRQEIALYNIGNDSWLHVCDLPSYSVLASYSIVGHNDHAYIVGGKDSGDNKALDTVLIYDLHTGQQCGKKNLKLRRKECYSAIIGNTLYVGGGCVGVEWLNTVEALSLSEYSHFSIEPTETYHPCLAAASGRLIATGGAHDGGLLSSHVSNAAWMLDPSSGRWVSMPAMNDKRLRHGMCTVDDQIVIAVGGHFTSPLSLSLRTVEALKVSF